jgi:rhodanese-related sulfurtransferase
MMKYILVVFMLPFFLYSCQAKSAQTATDTTKLETEIKTTIDLDLNGVKNLIQTKKDLIILDVRTPAEVSEGVIPNAIIINIADPEFDKKVSALDKSKEVLVYCKAGGRSAKACKVMESKGFKALYNMKDGYDGWKNQ